MKTPLLYIVAFFIFLPAVYSQHNVLYGERNLNREQAAVYFDKEGTIYPDHFIADSSLQNADASLNTWYQFHPLEFIDVSKQYNCVFENFSPANVAILQDSVIATIRHRLNMKAGASSLTFLIHGFRKPFVQVNKDVSSENNFQILALSISKFNPATTCFVEVYWDGLYDCCYSANSKKNKRLFRLLVSARENAIKVGIGFRRLLAGITSDKINIITHSLGAEIATVALFGAEAPGLPTPSNKTVNLCLVAPAIAGTAVFQHYYKRNTSVDYTTHDNYRLLILYNKKDFVLRKRDNVIGIFGPGPYNYINTTLGCNFHGEATKLEDYFKSNFPHSVVRHIDLSVVGKCHHVSCYCEGNNMEGLVRFISE